jgi:murein DD-endopeptidase MepM/ murein hydrolase activator NlpD
MLKKILAVIVLLIVAMIGFIWFRGQQVVLKPGSSIAAVGEATPVTFTASGANGVKNFSASIEQNGQHQTIYTATDKSAQTPRSFTFPVGRKQAAFLKEGPAKLIVQATSNDFRGQTTTLQQDVRVVLRPPSVTADGVQHYINQGGAELVVMDVDGDWSEAGVRVGPDVARSFAMPGQPEDSKQRFSLFPYSYALPPDTMPVVYVKNLAGTEATATFWVKVFPKKFHDSTIDLTDENMRKVVNDIDPAGTGDLVTRFVHLNRDMRKQNNQTLADLRLKTEHKVLWSGIFEPILGKRESYFADHRTYMYQGKKVDEQVHLGFDIAAHEHMPVKVANNGKVVYADRLGIYGNCVVVDHGYGLQTLYGHMSKIDVKVGDTVEKKQSLGLSGSTGMAFGDHVHFSMLVEGVQVNPIEWWDEHWIHDRILSKIGEGAKPSMEKTLATKEPPAHHAAGKKHHKQK